MRLMEITHQLDMRPALPARTRIMLDREKCSLCPRIVSALGPCPTHWDYADRRATKARDAPGDRRDRFRAPTL